MAPARTSPDMPPPLSLVTGGGGGEAEGSVEAVLDGISSSGEVEVKGLLGGGLNIVSLSGEAGGIVMEGHGDSTTVGGGVGTAAVHP